MKTCKKCSLEKHVDCFSKCKSQKDGKQQICKACFSDYNAKRYIAKKELIKSKVKEYREKNKEKIAELKKKWFYSTLEERKIKAREYYVANKEKIDAANKDWRKNNKEAVKNIQDKWLRNNTEKRKIISINYMHRRRAKIKTGFVSFNIREVLFALQNGRCNGCKCDISSKNELDHIMPLALGGEHSDQNLQLLCPTCNRKKSAKHPDVWHTELESTDFI